MKKVLSAAALSFAFASFASFAADPPKAAEKVVDKKKTPAAEMKSTDMKTETKTTEVKTEAKTEAADPMAADTKPTAETKTPAPATKPAPKK